MGLFSSDLDTFCPICNNKLKTRSDRVKTKDETEICIDCSKISKIPEMMSVDELRHFWEVNNARYNLMRDTKRIKSIISLDNDNKLFYIHSEGRINSQKAFLTYAFDEIEEYEVEDTGESITKKKGGIKRAVAGGLLFGGAGAIVGAGTSKANTIQIKNIVVKINSHAGKRKVSLGNDPAVLDFLDKCIDSNEYLKAQQERELLSQAEPQEQLPSAADEIIKFKKLLDDGIITQEEFDLKKKQLLGL